MCKTDTLPIELISPLSTTYHSCLLTPTLTSLGNNRWFSDEYFSTSSSSDNIKYKFSRKIKAIRVHLSFNEFHNDRVFNERISSLLEINSIYTVYVKVRYENDKFIMLGSQFGFKYESTNDLYGDYDNIANVDQLNSILWDRYSLAK